MKKDKYVYFIPNQLDDLLHDYGWSYNDFDNDKKAHIVVSKSTLQRAKKNGRMTRTTYSRLLDFLVKNKREYVDGRKRNYLKRLREKRNNISAELFKKKTKTTWIHMGFTFENGFYRKDSEIISSNWYCMGCGEEVRIDKGPCLLPPDFECPCCKGLIS